jgi:hypothetical protein
MFSTASGVEETEVEFTGKLKTLSSAPPEPRAGKRTKAFFYWFFEIGIIDTL